MRKSEWDENKPLWVNAGQDSALSIALVTLRAPKRHKICPYGPVPSRRPGAHAAVSSRRAEAVPGADKRSTPAPAAPRPPPGASPGRLPAARCPIAARPTPATARTHPPLRAPGPAQAANQRRPLRRGGRDMASRARSLKRSGFRSPRAAPLPRFGEEPLCAGSGLGSCAPKGRGLGILRPHPAGTCLLGT